MEYDKLPVNSIEYYANSNPTKRPPETLYKFEFLDMRSVDGVAKDLESTNKAKFHEYMFVKNMAVYLYDMAFFNFQAMHLACVPD